MTKLFFNSNWTPLTWLVPPLSCLPLTCSVGFFSLPMIKFSVKALKAIDIFAGNETQNCPKMRGAIPKVKWKNLNSYCRGRSLVAHWVSYWLFFVIKNNHLNWIRNSYSSLLPNMLGFTCFKHQTNISVENGLLPICGVLRNLKWSHS